MIIVMIPQLTRPNINEDNFDPATIGLESSPSIVRYRPYCHHHTYNYQYQHHHLIMVFLFFFAWFAPFHFRFRFEFTDYPESVFDLTNKSSIQTGYHEVDLCLCICLFVYWWICVWSDDQHHYVERMLMISVKIKIMTNMMKRVMSMMMILIKSGKK